MSEHTPSPWRQVSGDYQGQKAFGIAGATQPSGSNGHVICMISIADLATDEDAANARLIATAPDLLAACEALVTVFGALGGGTAIDEALQAIARAKGETE